MRVAGKVGAHPIHILVDSGSTHNFLDAATAKQLKCELFKIPPIAVAVADGAQLSEYVQEFHLDYGGKGV